MNEPETIRTILKNTKTIAVVGLSDKPERPSYGVAKYMQQQGYRIVPINPEVKHPIPRRRDLRLTRRSLGRAQDRPRRRLPAFRLRA